MATLNQWLELAPKAEPLGKDQKWHIFLSYRSVHRPWIIQLYDVLRQLGYEVFLDQSVIAASTSLIDSLQDGLSKSGSGILVWSIANEESEWCNKEYKYMETRATKDKNYHYVTVKLDKVELPEFGSERVFVDFTDSREGPRGAGLLRLLYGISGQPLPDEAVKLAATVDEETKQAMASIRAATEIGNGDQLRKLASSESLAWYTSPLLGSLVAEGLIKLKRYEDALFVLSDLQMRFPKAIRPRQLQALALARKKESAAAQAIAAQLYAEGERDPETIGIYARTWMDRYNTTKNKLHLRKSRDLYAEAFQLTPSDYYTGINAAAKSVLLGDTEKAKEYATAVEALVGNEKVAGDYWKTATIAEVQLIKGNYQEAAALYAEAVAIEPDALGNHEATWGQAQLLMDKLSPTDEERSQIAEAFAHLSTP